MNGKSNTNYASISYLNGKNIKTNDTLQLVCGEHSLNQFKKRNHRFIVSSYTMLVNELQ